MDANFDALARRQHSLVTARQLTDLGWSRKTVDHATGTGVLTAVRRGVFRSVGAPESRHQAWLAAVLAAGGGAVLSHASAASLWGWDGYPDNDAIHLLSEGDQRPRMKGVEGHRTDSLPAHHRTRHELVPATTPARTLVDVCRLVPFDTLEKTAEEALRRKQLTLARLARVVEDLRPAGRRQTGPAARLLAERVRGYDPGGSRREVDLVKLLVTAGLPRPDQQIRVRFEGRTYYVDLGWASRRVGFEYDSSEFHRNVRAFHADRERLRRLKRAGWDIWPVTSRTSDNEILAIAASVFAGT